MNHFNIATVRLIQLLFLVLFSWGSLNASDNVNPLYVVDGIKVEAKADSAVKAQSKAIEQAKIKAFKKIVEQKFPGQTMSISAGDVENLVLDYEVQKQKQSAYSYKATVRIRFNEGAINKYISGHKTEPITHTEPEATPTIVMPTDAAITPTLNPSVSTNIDPKSLQPPVVKNEDASTTSTKIVVIPILKDKSGKTRLWGEGNPWYHAWATSSNLSKSNPMVVPIGDLADINELPIGQISNQEHLNGIARKYKAGGTLVAIAEEQEDGSFAFSGNVHKLNNENRTIAASPMPASDAKSNDPYKDALSHFIKEFEQGGTKTAETPTINTEQTHTISLDVPIATLKDWQYIKSMLSGISTVKDVKLNSISTDKVSVNLTLIDSIENFNMVLGTKGFNLNQRDQNLWEIERTNQRPSPY